MRILRVIALSLVLLLMMAAPVRAEPVSDVMEQMLNKQLEMLDLEGINHFVDQLTKERAGFIPEVSLTNLISLIRQGKGNTTWQQIGDGLLRYLFSRLATHSALLGKLIVLAIISAVLQSLAGSFDNTGVTSVARLVCYLLVMSVAIFSFGQCLQVARSAIAQMVTFMQAMLPLLMVLITAVGGVTTAAVFRPVVIFAATAISQTINNFIIPLTLLSVILQLVNNLSERFKVSRLATLMKDFSYGALGVGMTLFIGVVTAQGKFSAVADGVAFQSAKFATKNFVPVIGSVFADAVEMVAGCSLLLKNGLGVLGSILIFMVAAFPSVEILVMVLVYRVAAAAIQPMGENQVADTLNSMGNTLLYVFAAVASVGVMFFVLLTTMIGAGTMAVLIRK